MPYTRKNIQLSEYSVNSSHKLLPCLDQFVGHKQMKQQSQLSLDWNKHMQTCYRTSAITLLKMKIFAYEKGCLTTLTTAYHDKKWGMSTAHWHKHSPALISMGLSKPRYLQTTNLGFKCFSAS